MATYEYRCENCGLRFARRQAMADAPLTECPDCQGPVHRVVTGGTGFLLKGGASRSSAGDSCASGACSLAETGRTCCGLTERCG
jgi:putative FmdB family regulatory protein